MGLFFVFFLSSIYKYGIASNSDINLSVDRRTSNPVKIIGIYEAPDHVEKSAAWSFSVHSDVTDD